MDKVDKLERRRYLANQRRITVLDVYGGKCEVCGTRDYDILCVDHVHGGGTAHRRAIRRRGSSFYEWLIKNAYPEGFRILCANCNMRKMRNENG